MTAESTSAFVRNTNTNAALGRTAVTSQQVTTLSPRYIPLALPGRGVCSTVMAILARALSLSLDQVLLTSRS